jgi:hypothetical protein
MVRTGGCLCGAIRYSVSTAIKELRACHCVDCQRSSGAHGAVVAFARRDGLQITRGTPKSFAIKAASGRTLIRYFCADCGSPLWSHRETTPDVIGIRAGTLDDSTDLKITAHIWTKSAQPWSYIDPAAKQYPGQPEAPPAPAA